MKKTIITSILIFVVGVLIGACGLYLAREVIPVRNAKMIAQEQQKELDSMVRQGIAEEITADTIKVNTGSDVISLRTNQYTTVQVGMTMVSAKGQKTDLTKYFKAGENIDLLVKEDQALAIHRALRPDEVK
ncbi:hypothetical protein ACOBQJ_03245 [Pelotomaculum propionicicum]|uniref:hypothetical protein n=1 Tax=Pelotomaculum propionicicum TaxID=258475 RepID=UPI003B76DF9F